MSEKSIAVGMHSNTEAQVSCAASCSSLAETIPISNLSEAATLTTLKKLVTKSCGQSSPSSQAPLLVDQCLSATPKLWMYAAAAPAPAEPFTPAEAKALTAKLPEATLRQMVNCFQASQVAGHE